MKPHDNIEDHTIPIQDAMQRTAKWRQVFMETFGVPEDKVFRGFRIPIQDIQDIASRITSETTYIRAYLSAEENMPPDPIEGPYKFSILLVPVGPNEKDILTQLTEKGETKSTIYDFTQPCPPCCDINSPLYHGLMEE